MPACEPDCAADHAPLVVHMIDELPRDGAEMLLLELMRLRHPGLRYAVVCLVRGGVLQPEFERLGVPVIVFGRARRIDPALLWRVASWLRLQHAAVVHTHLCMADAYGRVAARLAGVPAVFSTVHNIAPCGRGRARAWLSRALARLSTAVVGCSDEVAQALVRRDGLAATRVRSIPNGIDLMRFAQSCDDGVRAEFGLRPGQRLLGVVARLHPQKGHADLLRAMASLPAALRGQLRCLIIGTGELEAQLRHYAAELGLHDCVVFTGERADVPRLLAALDVFVLPSHWEGLPMALLEAMASSRAVLCTRVGGIPEVLHDGVDGLLVAPGDVQALCRGLEQLLTQPARAAELGRQARAAVIERFDVTRTAAAYNQLHLQALAGARAPLSGTLP